MTYGEKIELEKALAAALEKEDVDAIARISKQLNIPAPRDRYDLSFVPHCC